MSARNAVEEFVGRAVFTRAATLASMALAISAPLLERICGPWMVGAATATAAIVWAVTIWSMRFELEARFVPWSLSAFIGFTALSVLWSRYPVEAAAAATGLFAYTVMGVGIALTRDLAQIISAAGTVLRAFLFGSVAIEIFSGIIIDSPLKNLGVHGNLERFGPLQGLAVRPDLLGVLCLLACVTTYVELRMRTVSVGGALVTAAAAVPMLLMSRSAFALALAVLALLVTVSLGWIGQALDAARSTRKLAVAVMAVLTMCIVWLARWPIAIALNGYDEVEYRLGVWRQVLALFPFNQIIGRGYLGQWDLDVAPYSQIRNVRNRVVTDSASAYVDVLFQLGLVGLALLIVVMIILLVQSWSLATGKRAIVHRWPATVLSVIAAAGFGMTEMLSGLLWVLLAACATRLAAERSWHLRYRQEIGHR